MVGKHHTIKGCRRRLSISELHRCCMLGPGRRSTDHATVRDDLTLHSSLWSSFATHLDHNESLALTIRLATSVLTDV